VPLRQAVKMGIFATLSTSQGCEKKQFYGA
jgi:hypothetical protein